MAYLLDTEKAFEDAIEHHLLVVAGYAKSDSVSPRPRAPFGPGFRRHDRQD